MPYIRKTRIFLHAACLKHQHAETELFQDGVRNIKLGFITIDEVLSVATFEQDVSA